MKKLLLLVLILPLAGCLPSYAEKAAAKVQTHAIARDFYSKRFREACHVSIATAGVQYPDWCQDFDKVVNHYDQSLEEANVELLWVKKTKGAKMPLQLHALDLDGKAAKDGYKPSTTVTVAK